jgi:hypothetical protein
VSVADLQWQQVELLLHMSPGTPLQAVWKQQHEEEVEVEEEVLPQTVGMAERELAVTVGSQPKNKAQKLVLLETIQ